MSDSTALSRSEAVEELGRRYRVRFLVEVEHEGNSYGARGTTVAKERSEVEVAAVELLRVMLGRALDQLGGVPPGVYLPLEAPMFDLGIEGYVNSGGSEGMFLRVPPIGPPHDTDGMVVVLRRLFDRMAT